MNDLHRLETAFYDGLQVWAFRISNVDHLSLSKTFEFFEYACPYDRILVSEETSSKGVLHHHGLLAFNFSDKDLPPAEQVFQINKSKEEITNLIKRCYPDAKGNKSIYVRQSIDKQQLLKYTLKEGLFFQKGFTEGYIQSAIKLSVSKESMKKQFDSIWKDIC